MTNIRGELVPDNLRAEALAEYFEQVQWKVNDTEEYEQIEIDKEPIFEECAQMNTENITRKKLNHAIHRLKTKRLQDQMGYHRNSINGQTRTIGKHFVNTSTNVGNRNHLKTQWTTQASPRFTKREDPIDQKTTDLLPSST